MPPSNRGKTPSKAKVQEEGDPVEVFCRLRPVSDGRGGLCCKPTDATTVAMVADDGEETMRYKFTRVLDETVSQESLFRHVATPLIEDLVHAKNGLLFTYGITGSGKTYTMTGQTDDPGLLPRSLDMLFNTIQGLQAEKFTFLPDNQNGFKIQEDADRMLHRQKDMLQTPRGASEDRRYFLDREKDNTWVSSVDKDLAYSVFVSFVEIYNNSVYDLLEELPSDPITVRKLPQSKILREDLSAMMFVLNVKEVEVKDTEEAFAVLQKGQKGRKVAHTVLNAESSRSHSVFTIRLVQAPMDASGNSVCGDPSEILVSQLSLVDLAGSERTNRTKNVGERLREASQINNSLMTLRRCINTLRDNQKAPPGSPLIPVPFRDSKVTHLFRSYFEGEGKVRMVVCVNPQRSEREETIHVMNFAEATQEVQVKRKAAPVRPVPRTTSSRAYRDRGEPGRHNGPISLPGLPSGELQDPHDSITLPQLQKALFARMKQCQEMAGQEMEAASIRQKLFRADLQRSEQEKALLKRKVGDLEADVQDKDTIIQDKDSIIRNQDEIAKRKIKKFKTMENELERVKQEREEFRVECEQLRLAGFAVSRHTPAPVASSAPSMSDLPTPSTSGSDIGAPTAQSQQQYPPFRSTRSHLYAHTQTPKAPTSVGRSAAFATPSYARPTKSSRCQTTDTVRTTARTAARQTPAYKPTQTPRARARSPPPVMAKPNARFARNHRRSQSAGAAGERWLDHKPASTMDLDTVLQPKMRKKKSVSELNVKDTKKSSKYMLTHQQLDKMGNVRTDLIKGLVIPTAGGGSSVVFTGVETLKERSPGTGNKLPYVGLKPEDYDGDWTDAEERCKVAIEGHGQLKRCPLPR